MSSDIFYDPQIFTKSYEEALKQNERTLSKIRTFKKQLEDVKTNLEQNQNHLYQNIMVPIGSKALMKGKLVHTNEVTINVGDRWFIKKSAAGAIQTCNRMIERCNLNLAEYEKEMNLLCSNLHVPDDYEIFASGDVQDIVEPYNEDEEKLWREEHREKVRQYRQQLASKRDSEEDLFKKLDKLEEEEEEEQQAVGEIKNLDDYDDGDDDDDDEDEDVDVDDFFFDDEDIDEEEYDRLIEESIRLNEDFARPSTSFSNPLQEDIVPPKTLSKRVSFSDSLESTQEFSTSTDDDISIINFRHSPALVKNNHIANPDVAINSPADIYKKYLSDFDNTIRKPILKKTNSSTQCEPNVRCDRSSNTVIFPKTEFSYHNDMKKSVIDLQPDSTTAKTFLSLDEISTDGVFGDIVEKTPCVMPVTQTNSRRVSKFKQSRMKSSPTS